MDYEAVWRTSPFTISAMTIDHSFRIFQFETERILV